MWSGSVAFGGCLNIATRAETVALLRAAIVRSGLSASRYARDVLVRDPRTVRRWLKGDSPIPQRVVDFLHEGKAA